MPLTSTFAGSVIADGVPPETLATEDNKSLTTEDDKFLVTEASN